MSNKYNATEVGIEFYQIRSLEKDFHRNIYLKKFIAQDGSVVAMIFDPGTKLDLDALIPFLNEKIRGLKNINLIFLSHQDPDLTANLSLVMSNAPKSLLLTSVDTWRLVKMYGIPEKRVKTIEEFNSDEIVIKKTGHKLRFVPARYCHFRGSMMIYDYESRILYSGDFLGGVNTKKDDGVYATDESWEGISLFHQLYMPSTVALKHTVERILTLDPFPEIIAPQHGDIIEGENVHKFLAKLLNLTVGAELLSEADLQKEKAILAINNFLSYLKESYNSVVNMFEVKFQKGKKFTAPIVLMDGKVSELKVSPTVIFQQIIHILTTSEEAKAYPHLKSVFIDILNDSGIHFKLSNEEKHEINLEDLLE